jgi:16S rRNA (cytosine967-C5)-methyltransferase
VPQPTTPPSIRPSSWPRDGGRRHRGAGLVNAVLRRLAREGEALLAAIDTTTPEGAAIVHSMPVWIARLWFEERGADAALALMAAANEPPARIYRLADPTSAPPVEGMQALPGAPAGVALFDGAGASGELIEAAVTAGTLVPQSPGSALAAASLTAQPGERVLDLCAAPGIKTTQLAAAVGPDGSVTAVEKDEGRAAQLSELCERLGAANVNVLTGDARGLDVGAGYDRVLVDAPCTGLGTLAARPDARWRRRAGDVAELATLQSQLLATGLAALRPGGRAIYSVCTVSRAEGEAVLADALETDSDLELANLTSEHPALAEPAAPGTLQTLPARDGSDGFFIAAIERRGGTP